MRLSSHCPTCTQVYPLPGVQPSGSMQLRLHRQGCDGHPGCGSIVIDYSFPSGVQGARHAEPGQPYRGTNRTCYYPDNAVGWQCVAATLLPGDVMKVGEPTVSHSARLWSSWAGQK